MTEPPESATPPTAETATPPALNEVQAARAERTARLAKALRDNLRRRKAVQPRRDKSGN